MLVSNCHHHGGNSRPRTQHPDVQSLVQRSHGQRTLKKKKKKKNTHLLCKGKYHCMADLLFDLLVLSWFAYVALDRDLQVWSNPNQSNWRSTVQWYFALRSKWVFSDSAIQAAILILWLCFSSWWRMFKQGTVCSGPGSEFNHQQI